MHRHAVRIALCRQYSGTQDCIVRCCRYLTNSTAIRLHYLSPQIRICFTKSLAIRVIMDPLIKGTAFSRQQTNAIDTRYSHLNIMPTIRRMYKCRLKRRNHGVNLFKIFWIPARFHNTRRITIFIIFLLTTI